MVIRMIGFSDSLHKSLSGFYFSSMHPGDANIAGNVHGGTILKMIEEAGLIVSTRHCNLGNKENVSDFLYKNIMF